MKFENIFIVQEKEKSTQVELLCNLTLEYSRKMQVNFQILLETNQKNVELDLKNVDVVDSSGLTVLLLIYKTLSKKGLSVNLINVGSHVLATLEAASLTGIFNMETS